MSHRFPPRFFLLFRQVEPSGPQQPAHVAAMSHSNSQDNRALGDPQAVASLSLSGLNCEGGAGGWGGRRVGPCTSCC